MTIGSARIASVKKRPIIGLLDSFTGADGVQLINRPADTGQSWLSSTGSAEQWKLLSNSADFTGTANGQVILIPAPDAVMRVESDLTNMVDDTSLGIVGNAAGENDFTLVTFDSPIRKGKIAIFTREGGTFITRGVTAEDVITATAGAATIEFNGDSVKVWWNGSLVLDLVITDRANKTAINCGMRLYKGTGRFDNIRTIKLG